MTINIVNKPNLRKMNTGKIFYQVEIYFRGNDTMRGKKERRVDLIKE